MTPDDKTFYQGFAMAIGSLIRDHDEPTVALEIMRNCGVTIEDLRKAKVDGFDLRPIGRAARRVTP